MNRFFKISLLATGIGLILYISALASENSETAVTENTTVYETVVFSECGHESEIKYPIPASYENLSPEKAAEKLGGVLLEYSGNKLKIQKNDSACCENHYRLFLDGNKIKTEIKRTGELISEYPTVPSQFSENDLKLLKAGITADSKAELSALVEDFTS